MNRRDGKSKIKPVYKLIFRSNAKKNKSRLTNPKSINNMKSNHLSQNEHK